MTSGLLSEAIGTARENNNDNKKGFRKAGNNAKPSARLNLYKYTYSIVNFRQPSNGNNKDIEA